MNVTFVAKNGRCVECGKDIEHVYTLLNNDFCKDCLANTARAIFVAVEHYDKCNKIEDKILPQLERALERAKNMTDEEYLELLERCKGTKDAAFEDMEKLRDW